jgi:ribonucleoside-diphosphate reductase alpha chain
MSQKEETLAYFNGNQLAADVAVKKYLMPRDKTPDDMHRENAKMYAVIEKRFANPLSEEELYEAFKDFSKLSLQGSILAMLRRTLGDMAGLPYDSETAQIGSLSNCFTIASPVDSYSGIVKTDEELVSISKRRGGVGFDISNIRPRAAVVRNSAETSDGISVFMERFSNSTREVAQSGRRGALMLMIDCRHPEIETFINSKRDNGPDNPYSRVTGANISIRWHDDFLKAVESDSEYMLRWPVEASVEEAEITKTVRAREIFDQFAQAAWKAAEPGASFWSTVIRESVADCYADVGFKTIASNPCSELLLSAYDSCRLTILNLMGFVIDPYLPTARFDFDEFRKYARLQQRVMDDTVELELEAIKRILAKIESDPEDDEVKYREKRLWERALIACQNGRRTGGGTTALGDCLAALGVAYDSDRGVQMADEIYKAAACEYEAESIQLAKERGTFPVWSYEAEKDNPFLQRVMTARPDLIADWQKYGRRNICNGTSAPVGSMSLVSMVLPSLRLFGTTSGIEPVAIALETTRKRKVPLDEPYDLVDEKGDHWVKYTVAHAGLDAWRAVTGKTDAHESPYWGQTSSEINPTRSVEIQAAAQRWIGHAISKTCVLPSDAKWETVRDLYLHAWRSGCKGFTVYRDGSLFGVIESKDGRPTQIRENAGAKRPAVLQAKLHNIKVARTQWGVVVSLLDGKPYEVFLTKQHNGLEADGLVRKTAEKEYLFEAAATQSNLAALNDEGLNGHSLDAVQPQIEMQPELCERLHLSSPSARDDFSGLARTASLSLRHGVPVHYLCEQLEKATSLTDDSALALMRILKLYIPASAKPASTKECPSCKSTHLAYAQGCVTCMDCGWSKCS